MFTGSSSLFCAFSFNPASRYLHIQHAFLLALGQFVCDDGEATRTEKRNP